MTSRSTAALLVDVNVLIYAHRAESEHHRECREWLERTAAGTDALGLADAVLAGYVRVVTATGVLAPPTSLETAFGHVDLLLSAPSVVRVLPGDRHWGIFRDLARRTETRGPKLTDAWLAALAIEHGAEWVTMDRDFARFPGLRWRSPLDAARRKS